MVGVCLCDHRRGTVVDANSDSDSRGDIDADCDGLGALHAGFDRGGGRG